MIKSKVSKQKTIKTIDKTLAWTKRIKNSSIYSQDNDTKEDNINSYGSNKIKSVSNRSKNKIIYNSKKASQKSINCIKGRNYKSTKRTNESVKNKARSATNLSKKMILQGRKFAIKVSKRSIQGTKKIIYASISSIKGILRGLKSLVAILSAGGFLAIAVIVIICLIGLLAGSIYGIFFSSEKVGSIPMSNVVKEINNEMVDKIKQIQNTNMHDDYKLESNRAEWKEIISIYSAKISKGNNEQELLTLDEMKKNELKKVFWDMNEITYEVKEEKNNIVYEVGNISTEKPIKKVLYIRVKHKTIDDMMQLYFFNQLQRKQVFELLQEKYSSMWSSVIYGTPLGSPSIVQIALSQLGNVGGEPYWSWYGFNSRVGWCAIFVSWVANQAGFIESNVFPKFSGVSNGVNWFKAMDEWKDSNYIPHSGDIIFFDWENDGNPDHVGIVEKVENDKIHTIEGNSNDECKQKEYSIDSSVIYGYGNPLY